MEIIETNLKFKNMDTRNTTERIIVHHADAVNCTAEQIHQWHLNKGWSGAGYHFLVRKNGKIYRLRPEDKIGAHAGGSNYNSIGICFEGNFEVEKMNNEQITAGKVLIRYLKDKYKINTVQKHKDVCATSCPGINFPFDEITKEGILNNIKKIKKDNIVLEYQKAFNETYPYHEKLVEDGIKGVKTKASFNNVFIIKGKKNALIKWMQSRLKAKGFNLTLDGIFGKQTEKAVKEFQKLKGLKVDGIVGKNTINELF